MHESFAHPSITVGFIAERIIKAVMSIGIFSQHGIASGSAEPVEIRAARFYWGEIIRGPLELTNRRGYVGVAHKR